jgi:adenine C2-methylase RlmN of 23S rRNA A2503 and tRNA A37
MKTVRAKTRNNIIELEDRSNFMETNEMDEIGKETRVTFQWSVHEKLNDSLHEAETSAIALRDVSALPTQHRSHKPDARSLLQSTDNHNYWAKVTSHT